MKHSILYSAIVAATAIGLAGCGSSGSDVAGIGGTGVTPVGVKSSGTITGFGSVYVNGVKYDTTNATITIDDNPGVESDLGLGMRVTVGGDVSADGVSGTASTISFSSDLKGPVANLAAVGNDGEFKTLTVLGRQVRISAGSTNFDISGASGTFDFDTIANDNYVEISGFLDSNDVVQATRVELKAANFTPVSTPVEIKGTVENFTAGATTTFTLANTAGVTIDATNAIVDDSLAGGIADGAFVEVKGTCSSAQCTTLDASKVESGFDDLSNADDVEVEGVITSLTDQDTFEVNGIPVDASGAGVTRIPDTIVLSVNSEVEVEGSFVNDVLVATKVKDESDDIKIEATISSVDPANNSFVLEPVKNQFITVTIDTSTEVEDEVGGTTNPDDLINSLSGGDFVSVEGYDGGSGTVVASEVKRENAVDPDVIVQGIMDSYTSGTEVVVLGVTFGVAFPETEFEGPNDQTPFNQADFVSAAQPGVTLIKVKDKDPLNGVADEIEIELP